MLSQHQNASHIAQNVRKNHTDGDGFAVFHEANRQQTAEKKVKMVISSAIYANDFWLTMCNFGRLKQASDKPVNDL